MRCALPHCKTEQRGGNGKEVAWIDANCKTTKECTRSHHSVIDSVYPGKYAWNWSAGLFDSRCCKCHNDSTPVMEWRLDSSSSWWRHRPACGGMRNIPGSWWRISKPGRHWIKTWRWTLQHLLRKVVSIWDRLMDGVAYSTIGEYTFDSSPTPARRISVLHSSSWTGESCVYRAPTLHSYGKIAKAPVFVWGSPKK